MTPKEPGTTPGWEPDVLPGYSQQTLPLGPDPDGEGELVATLVRRGRGRPGRHAVLALHGYTDYFFNTELADHFAEHGFGFYALDLHKCGRSRQPGQTPHFTTDLARYDAELDRAIEVIAADGNDTHGTDETDGTKGTDETDGTEPVQVCVYGHSAGGLIATLWLDRVRRRGGATPISGLVLNSPFFDLHGPAILRTAPTSAALVALARFRKLQVIRKPTPGGYGTTLHRDYAGEFDYDLEMKPLGGFPITLGWINAIRRGQARLHRGLDVGVPNLLLRSDHSVTEAPNPDAIQRGDAVLDVSLVARWAGCVGNRQTIVPIADAKHDVFLSLAEPRATAYAELGRWLEHYLSYEDRSATTSLGQD